MTTEETHNEYLTAMHAARALGVSETRIRQLHLAGRLPATPTPLGRLYRASDVRELAAARAQRMSQAPAAAA